MKNKRHKEENCQEEVSSMTAITLPDTPEDPKGLDDWYPWGPVDKQGPNLSQPKKLLRDAVENRKA